MKLILRLTTANYRTEIQSQNELTSDEKSWLTGALDRNQGKVPVNSAMLTDYVTNPLIQKIGEIRLDGQLFTLSRNNGLLTIKPAKQNVPVKV